MPERANRTAKTLIGDIELICLTDVTYPSQVSPGDVFPAVTEEEWMQYHWDYPDAFVVTVNCFLIRTPQHTVLVDTGIGPATTHFARSLNAEGNLPGRLRDESIGPEDIDTVVFTHLHPDHVGWNIQQTRDLCVPVFPCARYIVNQTEWEVTLQLAQSKPEAMRHVQENVVPLRNLGKLQFVSGEHVICAGVPIIPAQGHSPGHMGLQVTSGSESALLLGDAFAHPLHVTNPDHISSFDADTALGCQTRRDLLAQAENGACVMAATHFPWPGFGRIVSRYGRRIWQPVQAA